MLVICKLAIVGKGKLVIQDTKIRLDLIPAPPVP